MENQAKGHPWTDEETEALVNLWGDENVQDALDNYSVRNNIVYGKLSANLSDVGITKNAKQCSSKIKHLREKYRDYKDKISKSGAAGSKPPKFFDKIDEILGPRPQTRPIFVLDSGIPTDNHDGSDEGEDESELDDTSVSISDLNDSLTNGDDEISDQSCHIAKRRTTDKTKAGPPQKRVKCKPTKFEAAMKGFTKFLAEENKKSTEASNSFHQQLMTLEAKRLEYEREEKERERQHEMRMMQMFGNMVRESAQQPQMDGSAPEQHQPVYTDLTRSNCLPSGFESYSLYGYK